MSHNDKDKDLLDSKADWSHPAVVVLLETLRNHHHLLQGPAEKRMDMWNIVSSDMCAKGYSYTTRACQRKWDNLKNRFKIIADRVKNEGRSRARWAYFDHMEELLQCDFLSSDEVEQEKDVSCDITPPVVPPSQTDMEGSFTDIESYEGTWQHHDVLQLLDAYKKFYHDFNNPSMKKTDVWKMIANELRATGCNYTAQTCQKKFSNMKNRFKMIADRKKTTGEPSRKQWEYFDRMEEILQINPLDSPPVMPSQSKVNETDSPEANWHHPAVMLLLDSYQTHMHEFQCPRQERLTVWKKIASEVRAKGYNYSMQACQKKWDNMRTRYRIILDRNKCVGKGRIRWAYFDRMDEILQGDLFDEQFMASGGEEEGAQHSEQSTETDRATSPQDQSPQPRDLAPSSERARRQGRKRKREKKEKEPSRLFTESEGDQHQQTLERLVVATEELNSLLRQLVKK